MVVVLVFWVVVNCLSNFLVLDCVVLVLFSVVSKCIWFDCIEICVFVIILVLVVC